MSFVSTCSAPARPPPCRKPPIGPMSRRGSTASFRAPRSVSSRKAVPLCSMPPICRKRNERKSLIARRPAALASSACSSPRISPRGWRGSNGARTMPPMATGNVARKQETFAIGAVRLAYDRCLGDAGAVAPQRPDLLVNCTGRTLTMKRPSDRSLGPAKCR